MNRDEEDAEDYDPLFDKERPELLPFPPWATSRDYPLITYSTGNEIVQEKVGGGQSSREVSIKLLPDEKRIVDVLADKLAEGGCAGIILNTVNRAQEVARVLKNYFGEDVCLLHSRFLAVDRAHKEKDLFEKLGPRASVPALPCCRHQIFEQSCDSILIC